VTFGIEHTIVVVCHARSPSHPKARRNKILSPISKTDVSDEEDIELAFGGYI